MKTKTIKILVKDKSDILVATEWRKEGTIIYFFKDEQVVGVFNLNNIDGFKIEEGE